MNTSESVGWSVEPEHSGSYSGVVLVAEDDPMYRKILESWLNTWGFRVIVAENGAMAWDILQRDAPKLLILDWVMPGVDGIELCRRIRKAGRTPYQYILLATAKNDRQDVVTGLEAGADDYLTKPFDRSELRARLKVGMRILALQDDLIQAREELRFQATHDVLTGMWNRRALLDLLKGEIERAVRSQSQTALLILDLDNFKSINDTYGHAAGDEVLKEVARRINQVVRSYDFVGRYGGEEFLVVLPDCGENQARQSAERIRSVIAGGPILASGSNILVTTSIGITVAAPSGISGKEILAIADAALYQAKNAGRNCAALL